MCFPGETRVGHRGALGGDGGRGDGGDGRALRGGGGGPRALQAFAGDEEERGGEDKQGALHDGGERGKSSFRAERESITNTPAAPAGRVDPQRKACRGGAGRASSIIL